MKILISSDLHYRLKQFDWIDSVSSQYDAVILAGDLLDISSHLDLNLQATVMQKIIRSMSEKTQVFVCSGNHDGNEKNEADEFVSPWIQELRAHNLFVDGDTIETDEYVFTLFPWWDGDVTKQDVLKQLEAECPQNTKKWIWVYHSPPDQAMTSWVGKRHIGDSDLNNWIEQYNPYLVISGHIHESPFKSEGSWADKLNNTWVLNAGSHIGDIPAHIIIDLKDQKAEWRSMAGQEFRELN